MELRIKYDILKQEWEKLNRLHKNGCGLRGTWKELAEENEEIDLSLNGAYGVLIKEKH